MLALAGCGQPGVSRCAPGAVAPVALSGPGHRDAQIAANAGDTAVVAWESTTGGPVQARVLTIDDGGERWSATTDLGGPGGRRPSVAVAPDGTAWVAWEAGDADIGIGRFDGSGWSTHSRAARSGEGLRDPQLVVDGVGATTLVALVTGGGTPGIVAAHVDADGAVDRRELVADATSVDALHASGAPDGTVAVAWSADGGSGGVFAAVQTEGSRWPRPHRLSGSAHIDGDLAVAAEPGGAATVVWIEHDDHMARVLGGRFDGRRWERTTVLDTAGGRVREIARPGTTWRGPAVAALPDGVVAAWALGGQGGHVRAAQRDEGMPWPAPTVLSAPGAPAAGVSVAARPAAVATIGWEEIDGGLLRVRTATAAADGCRDVAPARGEAADLRLAGGAVATDVYTDLNRGRIMAVTAR